MFTTLVFVIIILAAFALVWWAIQRLAVPEPVKTVVLVILGLVMLYFVWQFVASGGRLPALR